MIGEILKITIPALTVVLVVYLMLKHFFKYKLDTEKNDYLKKYKEYVIPLRLQAYERLVLFLERISLDNLIVRVSKPGMNARQLQSAILDCIRAEYEHNLSQQLYISNKAWELINNVRTNIVHLVNKNMSNLDENLPAIELAKKILEETLNQETNPVTEAIKYLKQEMQNIYF